MCALQFSRPCLRGHCGCRQRKRPRLCLQRGADLPGRMLAGGRGQDRSRLDAKLRRRYPWYAGQNAFTACLVEARSLACTLREGIETEPRRHEEGQSWNEPVATPGRRSTSSHPRVQVVLFLAMRGALLIGFVLLGKIPSWSGSPDGQNPCDMRKMQVLFLPPCDEEPRSPGENKDRHEPVAWLALCST